MFILHMACLYNFFGLLSAVMCYIICCLLRLEKEVINQSVSVLCCQFHAEIMTVFVLKCVCVHFAAYKLYSLALCHCVHMDVTVCCVCDVCMCVYPSS